MRLRGRATKRLAAIREESAALRAAIQVLDEQIAYAAEVAEDAQTRAIVSGSPLDGRERSAAADDLRRIRREREEQAQRLAALLAEQDRLLDELGGA